MPHRLDARSPGFSAQLDAALAARQGVEDDAAVIAGQIVADVRARGDTALLAHTNRLDRLAAGSVAELRLPAAEIERLAAACPAPVQAALAHAARRIAAFHQRLLPVDLDYTDADGVRLGARWTAIDSAGLYVPGGRAAYPSSVLMNAVPAKVAGVRRLVMVVPTPDGQIEPAVIAAARIAGVDEIWRIGGAQAVAALAYGTATLAPVDKIVGPGNAYVAAAKRLVFGTVGIDLIAGPSEILVVADAANDPDWIACDLLSQAEHDPDAQAVLITDDAGFADRVAAAVDARLARLDRAPVAGASWRDHGIVILVADLVADAPAIVDRIAPEHLELAVAQPDVLAARIRHAGAIFLGRHTPEAVGDYLAGPNHVLPTSGSARFSSGLGVLDFMKRSSLIGCSPEALARIGPDAAVLAAAEGLTAHGLSVTVRLGQ